MSEMQEALKRANLHLNGRPVIEIPAEEPKTAAQKPRFKPTWALLAAAAVRAIVAQQWAEREARVFRDNEILARVKALESRQDELISMIHKDDKYLDVRVQLDMMELKSNYRALVTQMEMMSPKDGESVTSLKDSLKQELFFLNKRFHDNQREHALLSERIEALEKPSAKP